MYACVFVNLGFRIKGRNQVNSSVDKRIKFISYKRCIHCNVININPQESDFQKKTRKQFEDYQLHCILSLLKNPVSGFLGSGERVT